MSITKKVSRGVKISSVLVLLGVIAGTFLGKWLPNFDGGDGVMPVKGTDSAMLSTEPPDAIDNSQAVAGARDVLEVTIKGRNYWVSIGENGAGEDVSLERAVELAIAAAGDENGIRVRVKRDSTARAKAEEELKQALLGAGIAPEAVVGLEQATP